MKWKRQLKTTFFLLLLIAGCLAVAQISVRRQQAATSSPDPEQVMQEISDALSRYQEHGAKDVATLRDEASNKTVQKAELVFDGISDKPTTQKLLDTLSQNDLSASFFLTGEQASAYSDSLALIAEKGYTVGLSYTSTTAVSSSSSAERAVSDFIRSGWAIQSAAGVWPAQVLMLNASGDEYLAAAYACSVNTVTVPTKTVTLAQISTDELASSVIDGIARGSILCVRLSDDDEDAVTAFSALCGALANTDLGARAAQLASADTDAATPLTRIYTSEAAVAFTFSGMGNKDELQATLSVLREVHAKGTFFVTLAELTQYSDEIKAILADGNSLGIAVQATRYTSEAALLEDLLATQESIHTLYQYTDELPVRPLIGSATSLLEKACGAGGFTLLSAMVNAVRTEDIRSTDATAVLETLMPEDQGVLQRGEIVHFQMNQYQKSNTMLSNLVKLVAQKRNIYTVEPVMTIANNKKYVYQYPLPASAILPEVKDRIYPGQLSGDVMTAISSRYIGVSWVATSSFLPGFTRAEIKQLDKKGFVLNGNNMVFLTFDDWGTDRAITEILDVLERHNATATFFVRTQNVVYNPNLLRAIAAAGNTIGCHTHTHFPLSNDTGSGRKFTELTDDQVAELQQDLITSYDLLQSIVGDMKTDGHPTLSLLFRPPTLAVGKKGLTTVFDCGFSYSVSGSYSTQDYKATNASKLAAQMKANTKSGAILVMHMSDNSTYTAQALDIYLSEMESKYAENPLKFVGLGDVLQ